jgi:TetR/AcrR family transcriptional regulator
MPAADRRESILASASEVFGLRGYSAATTEQIAQAAGISQPYVVRMFGTKEQLFVEVMERALSTLQVAFRRVIARREPEGWEQEELAQKLGDEYVDLIADRGILLSLMQGFVQGHDPVIGACARRGFLAIYALMRDEAGFEPTAARTFLAEGMLINTLLAIRLPENLSADDASNELLACTFGPKLDDVVGETQRLGSD